MNGVSVLHRRVLAVRVSDGVGRTLYSGKAKPAWNRHWLTTDVDGRVLLTSASSTTRETYVTRIPLSGTTYEQFGEGGDVFDMAPVVDPFGYTIVHTVYGEFSSQQVTDRVGAFEFYPTTRLEALSYQL